MNPSRLQLDDYDFALPPGLIAQHPLPERDASRLLVLDRERPEAPPEHAYTRDLPLWLSPGDLLVVNETRVVRARLRGSKASGGSAQALLLGPCESATPGHFRAWIKSSGKLRVGLKFRFGLPKNTLDSELVALCDDGEVVLAFEAGSDPYAAGEAPLPPYIERPAAEAEDDSRYQTTFARVPGAVAAPTAGLHLSEALLATLEAGGVERSALVLHVGPGTFKPLRDADLERGDLHAERFILGDECAAAIERARARGGRVVAVGTTTCRVLEHCALPRSQGEIARADAARAGGRVQPGSGETRLFLRPGASFRVVDALLTNFHLPRSSLLLLVAAFAGRKRVLDAYQEAIREGYRFYSYGDAMLVR